MSASNGHGLLTGAASALTFRPPTPREDELPATSEEELTRITTSTSDDQLAGAISSSHSDPLAGSPSDSDELHEQIDEDDESGPTSSRASSGARRAAQRAQQLAARRAVQMAGAMAHQYLARDEAGRAVGLYLVDDDQAAAIADPLARIAARHAPVDSAVNNPDVVDGMAAMMGLADFVRVTIEKQAEATALRVSGRVVVEHDGGGHEDDGSGY